MKFNKFKEGFIEGRDYFSKLTSTIVNSVLLSIVYFLGVGLTSIFAKISNKKFLELGESKEDSYWEDLDLGRKEDQYYLRQF